MQKFPAILLSFFTLVAYASTPNFSKELQGKTGCIIVFNNTENSLIEKVNPSRCADRITSASTFKVPLSVMAFDQKIINQNTIFIWNGKDYGRELWNKNQTPHTWLKNSVVWVSQEITPKLGLAKIKLYLKKFNYGNQDFSGDPGKNNGLTHAWLGSSLKISADEQLDFLRALVNDKLPVSQQAMSYTKINMYLETLPNNYKLYGKTGSGADNGWFIGYAQRFSKKYLIIVNFTDPKPGSESLGAKAQKIAEHIAGTLQA